MKKRHPDVLLHVRSFFMIGTSKKYKGRQRFLLSPLSCLLAKPNKDTGGSSERRSSCRPLTPLVLDQSGVSLLLPIVYCINHASNSGNK